MSTKIIMTAVAFAACFALPAGAAEDVAGHAEEATVWRSAKKAGSQEGRRAAFKELYKLRASVAIYGRVVDQSDKAVDNADIRISWYSAGWMIGKTNKRHETSVKTDVNGCFEVVLDHPHTAFVDTGKDGYESLSSTGDLVWNRTSKENPVLLRLRKKGPTTFLVVSPNGSCPPDDLIQTKGTNSLDQALDVFAWDPDTGWRRCATPNADLRIDAALDAERQSWIVTYAVTNGGCGLIFSDSLFYEAPETGYVTQATVIVTNQEQGCYMYLKSRTPAVYSRIFFNHRYNRRGDQSLRLYCKAWVNPYGDRSLEYDNSVEASWRVVDELKDEAKAAIQAKKLAPKPDIPQRIKAMNEKLEREKAEKAAKAK